MSVEDLLYENKTPTTKKNYVGVEIEFLIPSSMNERLRKLLIKKNLQWNVHLGSDGSVRDPDFIEIVETRMVPWSINPVTHVTNNHRRPLGKEIRILATEKEMPEYINKVCDILKKCKAYVNGTCGLHVHLDMRNRKVEPIYNNFYALQSLMFQMQPEHRRKNKYCLNLTKKIMKKLNADIKRGDWDNEHRYYSINKLAYAKHKTLEVRLHEGTIDPLDIRKWVYLLIKIADSNKKLSKRVNNINDMDLADNIKEYVNGRIAQFAG